MLRSWRPLRGARFSVEYGFSVALVLLVVQAIGSLFLKETIFPLVVLCCSAALLSLPLLLSRLSDWSCWLVMQCFGIVALALFVRYGAGISLRILIPTHEVFSLSVPSWLPFAPQATIHIGLVAMRACVLILLGLLTWELTWGVLWLILRAGYIWAALLMTSINMLISATASSSGPSNIFLFAGLGLVLLLWHTWSGRFLYAQRQVEELRPTFLSVSSLAAGVSMLFLVAIASWFSTGSSASATIGKWLHPHWNGLWLQASSDDLSSSASSLSGFTNTLFPDGPFRPYRGIVMRITIPDNSVAQYWRGRIYDIYNERGWHTSIGSRYVIAANTSLPSYVPEHVKRQLTASIEVVHPVDGVLFAPGRPIQVNKNTLLTAPTARSGSDPSVVSVVNLRPGDHYTITAEQPFLAPQVEDVGEPSDPWYTQLPGDLDPAISSLAHQLTDQYSTVLEKVRALQVYLKSAEFRYNTEVGSVPQGKDPISVFLFQSHQGYCVHFSSAMALLARALHIPARVVSGYVSGRFVQGSWVVEGSDAHAWTEVFFTGTGWVSFEPTPGFTLPSSSRTTTSISVPVQRSTASTLLPTPTRQIPSDRLKLPSSSSSHNQGAPYRLFGSLVLLGLGLACTGYVLVRILRSRKQLSTVDDLYEQFCTTTTRRFSVKPHLWQTPYEFSRIVRRYYPQSHAEIQHITDTYVRFYYGGIEPTQQELDRARTALQQLKSYRKTQAVPVVDPL